MIKWSPIFLNILAGRAFVFGALSRNTFGKLNPKRLVTTIKNRPYAKLGGDAYQTGNIGLLVVGGLGSNLSQAAGGLGFIGIATLYSLAGDRPKLFAAASALSIPSIVATNWTGLQSGDPSAWIGTGLFVTGYLAGVFSEPFSKAFKNAKNEIVKRTLGKPRQVMGVLSAVSKGSLLWGAVARHDWGFAAVLVTWAVGDYFMARSSPGKPENKSAAAAPRKSVPA